MKGYMAVFTVLILLAVTAGIASTLTFVSMDNAESQDAISKGQQALYFSESCAEEAILRVIHDQTYSGGTFDLPQGQCEVSVSSDNGTYSLQALGKNENYQKHIAVQFILQAEKIQVVDWKEQ